MKILFIRNTGRISGSETYNINLFKELKKNPFLEICFLTNLPTFATRISKLGIVTRVIYWGEEGIGTKKQLLRALFRLPIIIPRYMSIIHSLEKGKRFNFICLQSMTEKLFLTVLLKAGGYRVIWTELGPLYATQMSRIITFLYKIISSIVDKIITISKDTRRDLIQGGVSGNKISVIYIGIDTNKFKPLSKNKIDEQRKKFLIRPNTIVVGFLGTVTDEKGIDDFVAISNELFSQSRNFHFVVIGNGPFLPWVKNSIRKLKMVKNYTFSGFIEDVTKYLGIINILFLPTRHYEGLSLALLEAQSMGKIVITSDMGGNQEIVKNGRNGFLYTQLQKTDIIKLIGDLSVNRYKMVTMGKRARENILERFNIQIQTKKFIHLFTNL